MEVNVSFTLRLTLPPQREPNLLFGQKSGQVPELKKRGGEEKYPRNPYWELNPESLFNTFHSINEIYRFETVLHCSGIWCVTQ